MVAHGIWSFLSRLGQYIHHNVGVYGPTQSGKTTLDKQLMTEGYVRPLDEKDRTHHKKKFLRSSYRMPNKTAKRVKSSGLKRTLVTRDIGGHQQYFPLWLRDMYARRVETLIILIDHRHILDNRNTDNQVAVGYVVEAMKGRYRPKGLGLWKWFRSRRWRPKRIIIIANKADQWMNEESYSQWERGLIAEHEIFEPFRDYLYQLQEMHIPVRVDAMAASLGWNVEDAVMKGMKDL